MARLAQRLVPEHRERSRAAGRLLEGPSDRTPREMTVRAVFTARQNPAYRPMARFSTAQPRSPRGLRG